MPMTSWIRLRPYSSAPRAGERGVVLILTLFIILITYALVTQMTLGTAVASQTTINNSRRMQMKSATVAAADQFMEHLTSDPSAGGDAQGMAADAAGLAGASEAMGGFGSEDGGAEGEVTEGEAPAEEADSLMDAWAKPMRIQIGEIQITAWAEDENAKFNLLSLISEDEDYRDIARRRFESILDRLRDEHDEDLSSADASIIADQLLEWLEGQTRDENYPYPLRKSTPEEQTHASIYCPEELLLLADVNEDLYFDQKLDDELFALGLESVFTVWTSLAFQPPDSDGQSAGASEEEATPQGAAEAAMEDSLASEEPIADAVEQAIPAEGGFSGAAEGDDGIGALVNINTAPRPVVEGILSEIGIPWTIITDILENRNEVDEEALLSMEDEAADQDFAEMELAQSRYGDLEQVPLRYLNTLEDLEEVGSWASLDEEQKQDVYDAFGVKSDVFSVFIYARMPPGDWQPEYRYDEPPGPVLRLRGVYYRRSTADGVKMIPLQAWHEVPFTRWRIPDFQDDLEPFVAPEF
ncbi:MAG: hypothetical protein CMJ96_02025 [Planctomycetes bacterium]|nr:hypothetical protein [Planctomycetota bacterium]